MANYLSLLTIPDKRTLYSVSFSRNLRSVQNGSSFARPSLYYTYTYVSFRISRGCRETTKYRNIGTFRIKGNDRVDIFGCRLSPWHSAGNYISIGKNTVDTVCESGPRDSRLVAWLYLRVEWNNSSAWMPHPVLCSLILVPLLMRLLWHFT